MFFLFCFFLGYLEYMLKHSTDNLSDNLLSTDDLLIDLIYQVWDYKRKRQPQFSRSFVCSDRQMKIFFFFLQKSVAMAMASRIVNINRVLRKCQMFY